MLRMLASRIVARMRESPVPIGPLPMSTLADLDRASEVTLQKATAGKLGLSEAREVSKMIDIRCRVLVAQEWERQLRSVANGSGTPKRFEGTLEELLTVYREMTLEADEKEDPRGNVAA